eukprot:scaffold73_cov131-Skeletonema_dohrnii-CCMP3373.AAC.12
MANYDGSLEAVDCHIHSVRYGMMLEIRATIMGPLKVLLRHTQRSIRYGARLVLSDVPNRTLSGHIRRCSEADTTKQSLSRE